MCDYPAGVYGTESYFHPDTMAECNVCGCEFDIEESVREDVCDGCNNSNECEKEESK